MEDASARDIAIFGAVLLGRLLVPLGIPRYPLPAIIVAFLLDGFDQTIFQKYTDLNLDFYQGYDKALDIYYLAIAYISTLRNWTNLFAFEVDRFLWFYRLVGVVLFELTHARWLLMVFPNTFEYFFDFYEGVRTHWNPVRMGRGLVLGAAAFIWIVIKLPQEWIIHVGQIDTTDWIKENIFGVTPDSSWGDAISNRPGVTVLIVVAVVALLVLAWWIITRKLPPRDRSWRFAADPIPQDVYERSERYAVSARPVRLLDPGLIEKVVMIGLICVVFAQILPDVEAGVLGVILGVALVVIANAGVSTWLARRGFTWRSTALEFIGMAAVNTVLILFLALIAPSADDSINIWNTLFFALLLTLIITMYDRFHPLHLARFERPQASGSA